MKPLETDHQVSTPSAPVNQKVMKPRYLVVTFVQIIQITLIVNESNGHTLVELAFLVFFNLLFYVASKEIL